VTRFKYFKQTLKVVFFLLVVKVLNDDSACSRMKDKMEHRDFRPQFNGVM